MKLPTTQALELMQGIDWIDDFFAESIPDEFQDDTKTICLVSEWLNEPTYYANRSFKGWLIGVEVQIFYKLDTDVDSLDQEIQLAQRFKLDDWTIEQSKNHIKDPDTNQVTKVFYFAKQEMLKESELNG